jgi:hypothetical protein
MKKNTFRALGLGVVGGLALMFASVNPAAAEGPSVSGSASGAGLGTGNAVVGLLDIPIVACGNGIAAAAGGISEAGGDCGDVLQHLGGTPTSEATATGEGAISGNLVEVLAHGVGVLCGNGAAGTLLGIADATDTTCGPQG